MVEKKSSVRVKKGNLALAPAAPLNVGLSSLQNPNPDTTSVRISYDAAVVPGGGTPVTSYEVYKDGVYIRNVTSLSTVFTGLTPSTQYNFQVAGVNGIGGRGELSDAFLVTTLGVASAPGVPTGLASTSVTNTQAVMTWSAVTATPTPGYNVYVDSDTVPRVVVAAGAPRTATISGLTPGTLYVIKVSSFNVNGESAKSTGVNVTTSGTVSTSVMRTDDVLNYLGYNAKVTYGSGTHDYGVPANKAEVIQAGQQTGMRVYRQELAIASGGGKTAQLDFMKALFASQGTKFHVTLGSMRNQNGVDVPSMNDDQLRVHASDEVLTVLDQLVTEWRPDVGLANGGNLSKVLHSIAGPNEFETQGETGTSWPQHVRVWQKQIWKGMREGKFWVETSPGPPAVGSFQSLRVGAGSGNAAFNFPTLFADVPVAGPSGRTNLTAATATNAAGLIIDPITGDREISQWIEMANMHEYQDGLPPQRTLQGAIDAYRPMIKAPGYQTDGTGVPHIISEGGYNHMGWGIDGADIADLSGPGNGGTKVPPWVASTYMVRAVAEYAKSKILYIRHELLDDPHTAWNHQWYWGSVWTDTADVTSWTRLADMWALRRLYNLLKDRSDPKVPATHSVTTPYFSVNTPTGSAMKHLITQKADGSFWLLLWRDVDVWNVGAPQGDTGSTIAVTNVNATVTFTHSTGTKNIAMWTPNKAVPSTGTLSTGHTDASSWATIPAGETTWSVASTASPKTITVPVAGNLRVLRIS